MIRDTSPKILAVEDQADYQALISHSLKKEGFDVVCVAEGEEVMALARQEHPDLILLDLGLPGIDGLEVCRRLKHDPELASVPVLMLSARKEEIDRILGLEVGADDYVVKPFSPRELALRIRAILKRSLRLPDPVVSVEKEIRLGDLMIDPEGYRAFLEEEDLDLTATEFKLLLALAKRQGRVATRDALLEEVWGYEFSGYERTVDTHVGRLRRKLGPASHLVETIRGLGYCIRFDL
ncbi:MAG: response regulator transcription factor [Candidatus Latescibacteria bacterium]|jgi:two-component system, OmpR family, phosphate regulon response regulator PhoB|nr:response regulator transcription factor [Candidatus Latescibacterota bacterium]MBT5831702.1 response regulator transcription factor [Candidatus Latescibacterota bacterium]